MKIVGINSEFLVTANTIPPLKFADQELLIDLSDWVFDAEAEIDPEEVCPRKLSLEFDQVNVAVSKDLVVHIGGMQYTPQTAEDVTGGIVDCRNNFQYTVTNNGSQTLPPYIRFNETSQEIWIIPHSRVEVGQIELLITASEWPESDESVWVENYLTINIVDSKLTNFISTPGPTVAYLDAKRNFTLPEIENIVAFNYGLELESSPDWVSYEDELIIFSPNSTEGV